MKFIIREMSWFKRRTPAAEPKPVSIVVTSLELVSNHSCEMVATYDNGKTYQLGARVQRNDIKGTWTVNGLDGYGHSVLCDIIE